jgi:hypothetical protein
MEAINHLIYWCTHHWWRQQIISFIDALFVDGSNKTPHLLMHSLLSISPCQKNWPGDLDLWHWKSKGFQILLRTKYVPSLVKIHWRMLILECSQRCYMVTIWPGDLDLWPMTLMETAKHLIYWCTLCWWRQQITSFIDALRLFIDGGNTFPHYPLANEVEKGYSNAAIRPSVCPSVHPSFWSILVWGDLLPPSTKSASINEVICCLHQQRLHQ